MFDKIKTAELEKLGQVFREAGFEIRLVGGVVRDLLLGQNPKDIDLCTDATPDEMIEVAKKNGFYVIPTGLQHGTVTFVIDNEQFEVTTLRTDVETDGRHATVEFVRSFEIDASRRDLSINAMSMDFEGNVFDYFGGQNDLVEGNIKFVGDASTRIQEDYLRILRYFRFMARFGKLELDKWIGTPEFQAIEENRFGLDKISGERIWSEFSKILALPGSGPVVQAMRVVGVMRILGLPWSSSSYEFISESSDALANLATLVYGDSELFVLTDRWKVSTNEYRSVVYLKNRQLSFLTEQVPFDTMLEWLVDGDNREDVLRFVRYQDFMFYSTDTEKLMTATVPVFPVSGKDLIDRGYKPSKELGQKLQAVREVWKKSNYSLTKDQLMEGL